MIDTLASEYGWNISTIHELPIDQTPQLLHALLNKKGVVCFLREYEREEGQISLRDKIASVIEDIDTTDLV